MSPYSKRLSHTCCHFSIWLMMLATFALSQTKEKKAITPPPPSQNEVAPNTTFQGSIINRPEARAITLKIPAPRGQILSRDGKAFATTRVTYQLALQYKSFEKPDKEFILSWAKNHLAQAARLKASLLPIDDAVLLNHYEHRRWLPLLISQSFDQATAKKLEPQLSSGLIITPSYHRYYPENNVAAHIIGYATSLGKLPTGPISFNEPFFEEIEGRSGLENFYNQQLKGEDGVKRLLFDEHGNKIIEEMVKRPITGGNLITTLNFSWQKEAEAILIKGCKRGAFVVIDVVTGEVLVMASRPSFDLNDFSSGISTEDYEKLQKDPAQPLYARAFQSTYPPASTYKAIVALAALNNNIITKDTYINCPAAIQIGNHTFKNWTKAPEGSINVQRALARSCNTWFYQVGMRAGAMSFLELSRELGMGVKSNLPLMAENPGIVPNNEYMLSKHKRKILSGDTANMSIGQGDLLASPLQIAQVMAGIANGNALPKLHMILQVQDINGRVIEAATPAINRQLNLNPQALKSVIQGMYDVVSAGHGTGTRSQLSYTSLCGKTGTAQWGPPSKNQRLAWFAGFLPKENPRYAFAVLYEGAPNETVSGGRMAAPMVKNFFEAVKKDIKATIQSPDKAKIIEPIKESITNINIPDSSDAPPKAISVSSLGDEENSKQSETSIPIAKPILEEGTEAPKAEIKTESSFDPDEKSEPSKTIPAEGVESNSLKTNALDEDPSTETQENTSSE